MPAAEADSPWAAGTAGGRQVPGASPQRQPFEQGNRASRRQNSSSAEFSACSSSTENPRPRGYRRGPGDYWLPNGSPRPWAAQGPALTDRCGCARGSLPVAPRTMPQATGRPGACHRGPTPCHPKAQPNGMVWKPPANNVTLLGYFRSRMGFLAQKFPDRPPKGCTRNSHAPRPRVSRGLRNHRASQPEKPQRFTDPARPHTAERLKSRT